MTPRDLLQAGKLDEAIDALSAELRENPADAHRRTFLFELLCFAGKYDRAEKQLAVVGQGSKEAEMGALLYHSALHAERMRQQMFESKSFPLSNSPRQVSGTLNGTPFESITDADPRIGARLELFAAGQYTWLPFEHIASVQMLPPKRLRDMLWAPAIVRPSDTFRGMDMGEVIVPVRLCLAALPGERIEAIERVYSHIQALGQAYADYYAAVADYDRARFRLYHALGNPAQALGDAAGCKAPSTHSHQ